MVGFLVGILLFENDMMVLQIHQNQLVKIE